MLSNLFTVELVIEGDLYHSVEQYYQMEKARFGNSVQSYNQLRETSTGMEAKRLSKWLSFGNLAGWYPDVAKSVMRKALQVKFGIPEFRDLLLSTFPHVLAENNVNMYWGVGLSPFDSRRFDQNQWLGQNWMGELLGELREELMGLAGEVVDDADDTFDDFDGVVVELCTVCGAQTQDLYEHFLVQHLPWWFEPHKACFVCKCRLGPGDIPFHFNRHKGQEGDQARFGLDNLSLFSHLQMGLLHFLKDALLLDGVQALLPLASQGYQGNVVLTDHEDYYHLLFCSFFDPITPAEPVFVPPSHLVSLLVLPHLMYLFSLLPNPDQAQARVLYAPKALDGSVPQVLPPVSFFDTPEMVDSHLHLDTLLSKCNYRPQNLDFLLNYLPFSGDKVSQRVSDFSDLPVCCLVSNFVFPDFWGSADNVVGNSPVPTFVTFGVHPHLADMGRLELLDRLEGLVSSGNCVGVGETGIDYSCQCKPRCVEPWKLHGEKFLAQEHFFRVHVRLASQWDKVLVIHSRDDGSGDAAKRCLEILVEEGGTKLKIHRHCFTGLLTEYQEWVRVCPRVRFSFSSRLELSDRLKRMVQKVRLRHIMAETDAPYLSPRVPRFRTISGT